MVVIYDSNEEVCPFSKFLKKKKACLAVSLEAQL